MDMTLNALISHEQGTGSIEHYSESGVRMAIPTTMANYSNAQLDDYHEQRRAEFQWRAPLRMHLRARASHPSPIGTLGFGFWNDPFTLSLGQRGAGRRFPAPPQTAWYFYASKPNDLSFTRGVPGYGWKAMVLRSPQIPSPLLLPAVGFGVVLSRIPFVRAPIINAAKASLRSAEASIDVDLRSWHTYEMIWNPSELIFKVDGGTVLSTVVAPRGPLGFVIWMDNQYAMATEGDGLKFGVLPVDEPQWLEAQALTIEKLPTESKSGSPETSTIETDEDDFSLPAG